ncbi:MAG: methyltransferase small domain protein, partial [Acinetobacter sp.]|nr:methyltransferase small domain protein [Acinetobacter sp.]
MKQHLDTSLLQQHALLFLLKFLKEQNYRFTVITPLTHERIIKRKESLSSRSTTLRDIFGWNLTFAPEDLDPQLFVLLEKADLIHIENNQCFSKIR